VVTFSYEAHVRTEVPSSPKIVRIRTDISWKEVIANSKDENRFFQQQLRSAQSIDQAKENYQKGIPKIFEKKPKLWENVENRRAFFEKFAKSNGFDPRAPANWYNITLVQVLPEKGAKQVLQYHKRSLRQALIDLFPDIGLDKAKLIPSWQDPKCRRKFFEDLAHAYGFDPLKAENWYWQTSALVKSVKGGHRVLNYHQHSVNKAIADLFPDIGFDESRIISNWEELKNRRKFFEEYAKQTGFDPLVPANWYNQTRERIMSFKGAEAVMAYHDHKVSNALLDCFPEIHLNISKLPWYIRPKGKDSDTKIKL
jgi:hypothetical protein